MTDAELIARLRVNDPVCEEHFTANIAADRIEALIAERDEAVNQLDSARHSVDVLEKRCGTLIAERDHWSGVARREGVCMTCRGPYGASQPYGCSDCLNTGYCGEHHNTVADLEAKLAKAVEALEYYAVEAMPWDADDSLIARATLAEIKGESHE